MVKELTLSPLNRVEGDLEIKVKIDGGKVIEAYSRGLMFRGFEILLKGRDPLDPLVITPRICGICGNAHLASAAVALDRAFKATVPLNGRLVRNVCLATEISMSHLTQIYLSFLPDFLNKQYSNHECYKQFVERFSPLKGRSTLSLINARKKFVGIVAILGGQWPHSHFMIPGGVASSPDLRDITSSLSLLSEFKSFFESTVLSSQLEEWLEIKKFADLRQWAEDNPDGDLSLFVRCGLDFSLHEMGRGCGNFLSFGGFLEDNNKIFWKRGFYDGRYRNFDQGKIEEHVRHSWYENYEGGRHPFNGQTQPSLETSEDKYSWGKAPRYAGKVVEVGPLARGIINKDPLIRDMIRRMGPSVYTRVIARFHEAALLLDKIREWLQRIDVNKPYYKKPKYKKKATGYGLIEAARGALGHWTMIEGGRIKNYQIITPTAWNASPRDSNGIPGNIEQALEGTPVRDEDSLIEVQHIVRSFDPCLVCTVHTIRR
jgi:hydrogenase large subunit